MTLPGFDPSSWMLYPGTYPFWKTLWIQNLVLVFLQFTTAAALYAQDTTYTRAVTGLLERVIPLRGRRIVLMTHVASGLLLLVLNLFCTGEWFYFWVAAGTPLGTLFSTLPMAWFNLLFTVFLLIMAVTGLSMYRTLRPSSILSRWDFGFAGSRLVHRGFFLVIIGILGYHVFFMVSDRWLRWLRRGDPFSVLVLLMVALWGLVTAQSLLMGEEMFTRSVFRKDESRPVFLLSSVGGLGVLITGTVVWWWELTWVDGTAFGFIVITLFVAAHVYAHHRPPPHSRG